MEKKWRVDSGTVNGIRIRSIYCNNSGQIATMLRHNPYTIPESEIEENAKLIAAAPELLESLNELFALLEEHKPNWYLQGHYKRAHAAISKATGK